MAQRTAPTEPGRSGTMTQNDKGPATKQWWACHSVPSCERAALDEILRSLHGSARARVVLRLE
jgi:hypothetical protein